MRLQYLTCVIVSVGSVLAAEGGQGLARHVFGGRDFGPEVPAAAVEAKGGRVVDGAIAGVYPNAKMFACPEVNAWTRHEQNFASVILCGALDVPETGDYEFTSGNRELYVFDGRLERESEHARPIRLEKGRHSFERWIAPRKKSRNEKSFLAWRRCDGAAGRDAGPTRIPAACFSCDAADLARTNFFPAALPMSMDNCDPDLLRWQVEVREGGLYQLCVRRAGNYRWGVVTPASRVGIWLDGVHRREYHTVVEEAFFRDDERLTLFLHKGRHVLEFRGESADRYLLNGTRIWWRRPDAADEREALELTQTPAGESVFRFGDKVRWTVRRVTTAESAPVKLALEVIVQRASNQVARIERELPAGRAVATADFDFTCDREGAFEYLIKDADGRVVEGPWQFLVIDARRATGKMPVAPGKGPIKVDSIDFGVEPMGGTHQLRDNGTSALGGADGCRYRRTGSRRGRHFWCNVGEKDKGGPDLLPPGSGWSEFAKAPGTHATFGSMDWLGFTLHTTRPRQTHLAVFTLPADVFRRFPIQLLDPVTGASNGAAVEVPKGKGADATVRVEIPFWPNSGDIDVLLKPSSTHGDTRQTEAAVVKVELFAYPDGLPPLAEAAGGWNPERLTGWRGEQGDLSPERTSIPPLWDAADKIRRHIEPLGYWFMDYTAYDLAWRRYAEYAAYLGCNYLCWPIHSYNMAHLRTERMYYGGPIFETGRDMRDIDRYRRNTLKIILLNCEKYGIDFYGDTMITPNIPLALARGGITLRDLYEGKADPRKVNVPVNRSFLRNIVRTEGVKDVDELKGAFLEEDNRLGGNFSPVHPIGRHWLIRFYGEIAEACRDYPAFKGMNLRQWNACSTAMSAWWGSPLAGYDDYTLSAYARETGVKVPLELDRKARQDWLLDDLSRRERWFRWRAEKTAAFQKDILAEMRRARPDLQLRVHYHRGTGTGPFAFQGMGADASMMGKENGYNLAEATIGVQGDECNAIDPTDIWGFDVRKGVVKPPPTDKAYFRHGVQVYPAGLCTAQGLVAGADTTKAFAQALGKGPLEFADYGMFWAYPAGLANLREWMRAYRAIPAGDWKRLPGRDDDGYAAFTNGKAAYFTNLTGEEKVIPLHDEVTDLVRGGKLKELRLAPWGLAVISQPSTLNPQLSTLNSQLATLLVSNPRGERAAKGVLATFPLKRALVHGGKAEELRIFRGERELPLQIDPSFPTAGEDEVAFLVDFAEGEKSVTLKLQLKGVRRPAFPVPFAVTETNGAIQVACGDFSVGLGQTGFTRMALGGKVAYDNAQNGLLWWRRAEPISRKPIPARPLRLVSVGPVRCLAGYDFGGPVRGWSEQFKVKKAFPAYEDLVVGRVWQIRAGARTLEAINRWRYARAYVPNAEYWQWWEATLFDPETPMDAKRIYVRDGSGAFVENRFTPGSRPKNAASIGGDFGPYMSTSDRFVYWNGAAGLALAMDRSMIKNGFTFNHNFAVSMCNMAVPETGGFDMHLAVRALDVAPTDGNFDDLTELPRTVTAEFQAD